MMAAPKKEKKLKLFDKLKRRGRKSDEHTEVGTRIKDYKTHAAWEYMRLQHVKNWNDYATNLAPSGATSKPEFETNETLNGKVSLWYGDITRLQIDAIVNSASPDLIHFGEVGVAVHTAAGSELSEKCAAIGLCPVGEAKLTKGYKLPARYVIHAVAPRGTHDEKLKSCYINSLKIAKHNKIRSIAFPCIATLFCGYDVRRATSIAVSTVREWLLERDNMKWIDRIIFSVITNTNRMVYEQTLLHYFPVDQPETVPFEISQDPYALSLYEKAIKEGKERDSVIRVNIVGNFGQGKTTLKRRLVGQSVDDIESTNSIDVNRYKFTRTSNGQITCTFEKEDDSHEIVNRIVEVARKTELESSLEQQQQQQQQQQQHQQHDEHDTSVRFDEVDARFIPVKDFADDTSVKHESDNNQGTLHTVLYSRTSRQSIEQRDASPKRVLSQKELISFSKELRISDDERSKSKVILDIWDFGGQYVFYATHTMFHSRQAIYLLVFDLTVNLNDVIKDEEFPGETRDKDMEYFARFWMNSIHSFVGNEDGSLPPVILVGTHKDMLKIDDPAAKVEYCDTFFDKVRQLFEDTNVIRHIQESDFAVGSTGPTDDAVAKLLEEILRIGDERSKLVEIPAKWLPLEMALKEKRSMKKIITFEKVMQINAENEFPLSDENQVKLFLRYHHTKGTLFYFDEVPISNYVVLDPQYLIDAFKCIITSERFCKRKSSIRSSWNKLIREGKLEEILIDKVWSTDTQYNFMEYKDILLEFLKKHHIISEAMQFDEDTGESKGLGWYVVPSLLKDHSTTTDVSDFMSERKQTEIRLVMLFEESSLLHIVYSRLIAALLGKWSVIHLPADQQKHLLFENLGMFRLNVDHVGIVEVRGNNIELLVLSLCPSKDIDCVIADQFRRYCEAVVVHEFGLLRNNSENVKKPFRQAFRCNHETHGMNGSEVVENISVLKGTEVIPCPDLMKHEICSEKAVFEWFLKDQVTASHQNKELSEKELSKVAQAVGKNWQLLGIELGLTQVQVDQVSANNDTMVRKIYDMLKTWKSQNRGHSTMSMLVQALKNIESLTVNWDEIRNICDNND
ncbi:uncharacterized protein LOC123550849 [Mercenaria mercenaria]|uniref:uncharacterized protein LOC123550849 n=1 Tax=Mercenaria mercenaria TaxID=6596 RepID=UPI00234E6FCD|nr:uncharacterized protein LOC123550849 [Mercenaria mercenaria]XP_045195193.2 uncharacterized protein LOC123550849 [Mercenaria mercenaria]XP_045195194.2 uncharacterized protein LOC123550849 [Mercenaria mercenaria]